MDCASGNDGAVAGHAPDVPIAAHTHARLSLASGRELRFVDPRRFGRLEFRDLRRAWAPATGRSRSQLGGGSPPCFDPGSFTSRLRAKPEPC